MAITSSAKKAIRSSARKRVYNEARKEVYKDVVKTVKKLVQEKKIDEAKKLLTSAYKAIDKAAKTKFIKKNSADRKKSRLALLINRSTK